MGIIGQVLGAIVSGIGANTQQKAAEKNNENQNARNIQQQQWAKALYDQWVSQNPNPVSGIPLSGGQAFQPQNVNASSILSQASNPNQPTMQPQAQGSGMPNISPQQMQQIMALIRQGQGGASPQPPGSPGMMHMPGGGVAMPTNPIGAGGGMRQPMPSPMPPAWGQ